MQKSINYLLDQLVGIRWGILTTGVVDSVRIPYHGQEIPLKHLAHTSKSDSSRIMVRPHDPHILGTINNVLGQSGFNSYVFSKEAVCVSVPPPSGDQRKEVMARVSKLGEEAKVSIRNIRKKTRQAAKGQNGSEDKHRDMESELQELTDKAIAQVDEIVSDKLEVLKR